MIINHRCKSSTQIKPKTKDESAQDPTLKQFMNDLYQSTNAKNETDLYKALNDEVQFKGKSYMKDELKFDEDIFHELQVALTMGENSQMIQNKYTKYQVD